MGKYPLITIQFTSKTCFFVFPDTKIPGEGGVIQARNILHFKFYTKILHAICLVFLRICAGSNNKRPLFLMSNYWEPYIICSPIFKKWRGFCRARICRLIFPPAWNYLPPPPPR